MSSYVQFPSFLSYLSIKKSLLSGLTNKWNAALAISTLGVNQSKGGGYFVTFHSAWPLGQGRVMVLPNFRFQKIWRGSIIAWLFV